jgi:hypothetical protein
MTISFGLWDVLLLAGVTAMGTATAYLRHPEHKALILMLPVPFTLATLALGRPVDATNVLGADVLFGFSLAVWALHARLRAPIVPSIALSAAGYCAAGWAIARLKPSGDLVFWTAAAGTALAGAALARCLPYREEPSYRTPLPLWIKLPAIAAVVAVVIVIKGLIGGFVTVFPMVGVVAAYESRHSLWTIVRRIPWLMMAVMPMMAACRLAQGRLGLPAALAVGWLAFLPGLLAIYAAAARAARSDPRA